MQERPKTKFLQKYYHKGAFFQSGADDDRGTVGSEAIYARDFTGATGEDKFDREALPAVMQARPAAALCCFSSTDLALCWRTFPAAVMKAVRKHVQRCGCWRRVMLHACVAGVVSKHAVPAYR